MSLTAIDGRLPARRSDRVAVEEPLEIRIGNSPLSVTMRTPGHDEELAIGLLFTEGILKERRELVRLEPCREVRSPEEEGNILIVRLAGEATYEWSRVRRTFLTTSSCGLCGKGSIEAVNAHFPPIAPESPHLRLPRAVLRRLPRALLRAQGVFASTGGVHAAGIFDERGQLRILREDVGRHNAVDKVIGRAFLEGLLPLSRSVLMVSGRASFEIAQKALAARIPVVAAVSAPSSLAVALARQSGMTLVGFLRGESFNVYAGEERIAFPTSTATAREGLAAPHRARTLRRRGASAR